MSAPQIHALTRVRGLGEARARRILDAYGDNLDSAFLSPETMERLAAVIAGKQEPTRLARRIAAELSAEWRNRLKPEFEAASWLVNHGIDETRLAFRIVRFLGKDTAKLLQQNPYVLSRALNWATVDRVGMTMLKRRMSRSDALRAPERLVGAATSAMADILKDGSTATTTLFLTNRVALKLRFNEGVAQDAIDLCVARGHIFRSANLLRSPGCAWMETLISDRFRRMAHDEVSSIQTDSETVKRHLEAWRTGQRPQPSGEQVASVQFALERQLSVISGGAGTGKTTSMLGVVEAWTAMGGTVQLCTLSGKAALRLSQTTRRLAKTIHRLLRELELREKLVEAGKEVPDDYAKLDDKTLVLVDEASMVDLGLFCRLLEKSPEGCRFLLCGDLGQLPPIGPGIVFHEVAKIPDVSSALTRIFRQAEGSGIPAVAKAIRDRQKPVFSDFHGPAEGVDLVPCGVGNITKKVAEVVQELGGFCDSGHELQILAALNKRCDALNAHFHAQQAARIGQEVKGYLARYYSLGDPVVFLANDYKKNLFNGMLGRVTSVDEESRGIAADFEGQGHYFTLAETIDVSLAYCLSCHKLQGSQAERIIIAVEPTMLMEPSWLYTAITRAQKQAVLVGDPALIESALQRRPSWQTRNHGLDLSSITKDVGEAE